eukprot:s7205_g4.t1
MNEEVIHEDEPEPVAQPEAEDKKEKPEKSGDIKKPETSPKKAAAPAHEECCACCCSLNPEARAPAGEAQRGSLLAGLWSVCKGLRWRPSRGRLPRCRRHFRGFSELLGRVDKDVDNDIADRNHDGNHNQKDKNAEDKDADSEGNAKDTANKDQKEHKAEHVENGDSDSSSFSRSSDSDRPFP